MLQSFGGTRDMRLQEAGWQATAGTVAGATRFETIKANSKQRSLRRNLVS